MSNIVELDRDERGALQINFQREPESMTSAERQECIEMLGAEHARCVRDARTLHQRLEYLTDLAAAAERN